MFRSYVSRCPVMFVRAVLNRNQLLSARRQEGEKNNPSERNGWQIKHPTFSARVVVRRNKVCKWNCDITNFKTLNKQVNRLVGLDILAQYIHRCKYEAKEYGT